VVHCLPHFRLVRRRKDKPKHRKSVVINREFGVCEKEGVRTSLHLREMIRGRKIQIKKPGLEEETFFQKSCGVSRFTSNWGLNQWNVLYQEHKKDESNPKPSVGLLSKKLNQIRKVEYPWMDEVSCFVRISALSDLNDAFSRFFKGQNKYPKFKKKGKNESFGIHNNDIRIIDQRHILIGKLKTPITLTEDVKTNNSDEILKSGKRIKGRQLRILSATISQQAGNWYISFNYEKSEKKGKKKPISQRVFKSLKQIAKSKLKVVGVDLGLLSLATLSTGKVIKRIKPMYDLEKRIKKVQRRLSKHEHRRQQEIKFQKEQKTFNPKNQPKYTNNYKTHNNKLQRLHQKVSNIRKDYIHKFTTNLVKQNDIICLEDLNVAGMLKNHKLAKSISDVSLAEVKRQIIYKAESEGKPVVFVDRFYPSTKRCRKCFHVKDSMSLSERLYVCEICYHTETRDLNAARNILVKGLEQVITLGRRGIQACGDSSSTSGVTTRSKNGLRSRNNVTNTTELKV
jgi:putative transposase